MTVLRLIVWVVAIGSTAFAQPPDRPPGEPAREPTPRGWIGVRTTAVPEAVRVQIPDRLPESGGLLASFVTADSPAASAGVNRYDVLVKVGDETVPKGPRAFDELVANTSVGGTLTLTVVRGGRELVLAVVVAERPARPMRAGVRTLSGRPMGSGAGPRSVTPRVVRIQRLPNMRPAGGPAKKPPEGIALAEGPIADREVLLTTDDGESFDVAARDGEDSWNWAATNESVGAPEDVPEAIRKHVGRLLAGVEAERARGAFRFRVQPRAQGEDRSAVLLVQQATDDGAFRVLEVERTLAGDKLPVGRLLGVESLQSELELVEPVVRDRLVATLKRYRVPPVRATMRATR